MKLIDLIKVVFKNILSFPCRTASVANSYLTGGTYHRLKIITLLAHVIPFKHIRGGGEQSPKKNFRSFGPQCGLKIRGVPLIRHWLAL